MYTYERNTDFDELIAEEAAELSPPTFPVGSDWRDITSRSFNPSLSAQWNVVQVKEGHRRHLESIGQKPKVSPLLSPSLSLSAPDRAQHEEQLDEEHQEQLEVDGIIDLRPPKEHRLEVAPGPIEAPHPVQRQGKKGGRPRGSKGTPKLRRHKLPVHRADSDEAVHMAVLDLLWRKEVDGTAQSYVLAIELAQHICYKGKLYAEGDDDRQVFAIIYKTPGIVVKSRQSGTRTDKLIFLADHPAEGSKYMERHGWYWRGSLWSERALVSNSCCQVTRRALHRRLVIEGLAVEDAMKLPRRDNAVHSINTENDDEWREI